MKLYKDEYEQMLSQETAQNVEVEFGCGFCWDKRKKKDKELFFIDAANNMRVCNYCPYCGRKYEE